MLNPDISCFENNVDPDQLTYEKLDDQNHPCFNWNPVSLFDRKRIGGFFVSLGKIFSSLLRIG